MDWASQTSTRSRSASGRAPSPACASASRPRGRSRRLARWRSTRSPRSPRSRPVPRRARRSAPGSHGRARSTSSRAAALHPPLRCACSHGAPAGSHRARPSLRSLAARWLRSHAPVAAAPLARFGRPRRPRLSACETRGATVSAPAPVRPRSHAPRAARSRSPRSRPAPPACPFHLGPHPADAGPRSASTKQVSCQSNRRACVSSGPLAHLFLRPRFELARRGRETPAGLVWTFNHPVPLRTPHLWCRPGKDSAPRSDVLLATPSATPLRSGRPRRPGIDSNENL